MRRLLLMVVVLGLVGCSARFTDKDPPQPAEVMVEVTWVRVPAHECGRLSKHTPPMPIPESRIEKLRTLWQAEAVEVRELSAAIRGYDQGVMELRSDDGECATMRFSIMPGRRHRYLGLQFSGGWSGAGDESGVERIQAHTWTPNGGTYFLRSTGETGHVVFALVKTTIIECE